MVAGKSEYGDASLDTKTAEDSGLLDDIRSMGPSLGENLLVLVEKALAKGEPIDDKAMLVIQPIIRCRSIYD